MPDGALTDAPGWYGKLASLGDFASRRLPSEFIARWDAWLQQMIAASRARLGADWLNTYLTSPVWRFVEWPATPGEALQVGVLMPSVDKVGRYFPLCVAAPLRSLPAREVEWQALFGWLDRIEAAALATLDTRVSAQQFDFALLALPPPRLQRPSCITATVRDRLHAALGSAVQGVHGSDGLAGLLIDLAALSLTRSAVGASLWWTSDGGTVPLFACPGLPDSDCFTAMLRADPAKPAPPA